MADFIKPRGNAFTFEEQRKKVVDELQKIDEDIQWDDPELTAAELHAVKEILAEAKATDSPKPAIEGEEAKKSDG